MTDGMEYDLAGIDMRDYPDFCDAFIERAWQDGVELTEAEVEKLNEDRDLVYSLVIEKVF